MNSKKRLILGLVSGVLAVVTVLFYVSQVRAEETAVREEALARYGGEQLEICVATQDILPGENISASNTASVTWLASLLPENAVTTFEDIEGRAVSSIVLANEPLSFDRLDGSVSDIDVPEGLCAVSVPAQEERAVGGALSSGALVNVYVQGETGVTLLGENLLVLATSNATPGSSKLAWVTLAVTPESVQELLVASSARNLYFVLPGSTSPVKEGSNGNQ